MSISLFSKFVSWVKVSAALNVDTDAPSVSVCPLCRCGTLHVQKEKNIGLWFYCNECEESGDVIWMLRRTLLLAQEDAITFLANTLGEVDAVLDPIKVEKYVERYQPAFDGMVEFWKQVRAQNPYKLDTDLFELFMEPARDLKYRPDSWAKGPGKYIGFAMLSDIRKAFPYAPVAGAKRAGRVVIPFFSSESRMSGLWLGDGMRIDSVSRMLLPASEFGSAEIGMAFLPCAVGQRRVLIMRDVGAAARLHIKHAATSKRPIPITAYHDKERLRTGMSCWSRLPEERVIMTYELSASVLAQAITGNARIYHRGTIQPGTPEFYAAERISPGTLLDRAMSQSVPWSLLAYTWFNELSDHGISAVLQGLKARHIDLHSFAMTVDEPVRSRIRALIPGHIFSSVHYQTSVGKIHIIMGRWVLEEGNGRMTEICNFTAENASISDESADSVLFSCTVLFRGKRYAMPVNLVRNSRIAQTTLFWRNVLDTMGLYEARVSRPDIFVRAALGISAHDKLFKEDRDRQRALALQIDTCPEEPGNEAVLRN